jgi:hypothetical protein
MPPHTTSWRSILTLFPIYLGLPSGHFPWGLPTKILYAPLPFPLRATCPAHFILIDLITVVIFGEEYRSLSSSLCSLLHSSVTSSLLGPHLPQDPTLERPQPMFLPQCERPNFTPIPNNRQNYSSVYFNIYIFRWQTAGLKILKSLLAGISWVQSVLNFSMNAILTF